MKDEIEIEELVITELVYVIQFLNYMIYLVENQKSDEYFDKSHKFIIQEIKKVISKVEKENLMKNEAVMETFNKIMQEKIKEVKWYER